MAGDVMTVVQKCGVCGTEIGKLEVKKENMMLSSKAQVWCPKCEAQRPEVRDVPGRQAAREAEVAGLPKSSGR